MAYSNLGSIMASAMNRNVVMNDGIDTTYRFDVHHIDAAVYGTNAVYAFCRSDGANVVPLYIGKADILSERLSNHERVVEAKRLGATLLLVHESGNAPRVGYEEAERRLIGYYRPPMNTQHTNYLRGSLP